MKLLKSLGAGLVVGAIALLIGSAIGGVAGNIAIVVLTALGVYVYLNLPEKKQPLEEIPLPPISPLPEVSKTEAEVQAANDAKIATPPSEPVQNFDDNEKLPPP